MNEQVFLNGAPVGFAGGDTGLGQAEVVVPVAAKTTSPWTMAFATSVLGAATGWVIEEIASHVRGRRRHR